MTGTILHRIRLALGWLVPVLLAAGIAFGFGTASARWAVEGGETVIRAGAWSIAPSGGGASVDPYTRARLSLTGDLPLGQAEGLVLRADRDDTGQPLDASCVYALQGPLPPARWWSLWATPGTGTPERPSSLHSGQIVRDRTGRFAVRIAAGVQPLNWLAAPRSGAFTLTLALYDTPVSRQSGLDRDVVPALTRVSCEGEDPVPGGTITPVGSLSNGIVSEQRT